MEQRNEPGGLLVANAVNLTRSGWQFKVLAVQFDQRRNRPMSLDTLKSQIANAAWFARCGQFRGEPHAVSPATVSGTDDWDWLPTSREQEDPIHGDRLVAQLDGAGRQQARRASELEVAKCVLAALHSVPDGLPALADGPNDFTTAAKSGAVFAARMAVRELMVGHPVTWCHVMQLFVAGYWPCGWSEKNGVLVVL